MQTKSSTIRKHRRDRLQISLLFSATLIIFTLRGHVYGFDILDPNTWPVIPVPEVATDPNGGTTYGVIPVVLFHDKAGVIRAILAPDISNNSTLGIGGFFRYHAYPSDDTQWYVRGGAQENITRQVDLYYATGRSRRDRWSFEGRVFFERDPTERFYGLGNESTQDDESNYTTEQLYFQARVGLNLTNKLQLALLERPRYVRIQNGAFDDLPFIGTAFPKLKGLNGGSELVHELMLSYDTRDAIDIPRSGGLALAYGAITDRHFLSSVSYNRYGIELRRYLPVGNRLTLAMHFYMQYTPAGGETPFWSMARLGGEQSLLEFQQTQRGYGTGRFVDNNLDDLDVEARTRVLEATVFKTHGVLELAPFFDVGKVFHKVTDNPVNRLHPAGGVGFRAVADPFVVAYLDFGYASEGLSVFSGINYPF